MVIQSYGSLDGPMYQERTYSRDAPLIWARRLLAAMLLACILPGIIVAVSSMNQAGAAREALIPTYNEPQYVAFMNKVAAEVDAPAGTMHDYLAALKDVNSVEPIMSKFMHVSATGPVKEPMRITQEFMAKHTLYEKYAARYGDTALHDALNSHSKDVFNPFGTPKVEPSHADVWFEWGYLLSVLVAAAFLWTRVTLKGMRWGVELDKIAFYSLAWPIMVFRYPTHVDVAGQAKRAMARMGWFLAALLSIGSAGGALAKANQRTSYESDCSDTANTYVLDDIPLPKLTLMAGIETIKIVANGAIKQDSWVAFQDAKVSWKGGLSFDYGSTESVVVPGTSDERDFTFTKGWTLPKNQMLITGVGLFDIHPVASTKGGDTLSPFVEYNFPMDHGLTGFVRGDGYLLTGGSAGRDGFLARVGLRSSEIQLPAGFKLNAAGTVLYAKGPFHMDEGASARFDVSVSRHVVDRLTAGVGMTTFVPFYGAHGRYPDMSVNATVSYAVN